MSIKLGDNLIFEEYDQPTREGEVIETIDMMGSIPTPYAGMKVFVKSEGKLYIVKSLKSSTVGSVTVENSVIDEYEAIVSKAELERELNRNAYSYFTIVALEDGLTAKLSANACEYCIDGDGWIALPADTETVPIYAGQKLSFRCIPAALPVGTFTISKKCNVEGNVMSLLYGDDFADNNEFKNNEQQAFSALFSSCANLVDASALVLPAKSVLSRCYQAMFAYCTSLVKAPELPATTLGYYSYNNMFFGCTSLVVAPVLPAVTLGSYSYNSMFGGCTSLKYIKAMFTTTPGSSYTNNWVNGVASSGTFVKNKNAEWDVQGTSGIPEGWTVAEV